MALSITQEQAAIDAHNAAVPDGNEDLITISDVLYIVKSDIASKRLCDMKLMDKEDWHRLQADFSVSVTAGVGTLDASIYPDSLRESRQGRVAFTRSSGTQFLRDLIWMDTIHGLQRPKRGADEFGYFTVRGTGGVGRIYVYDGKGNAENGTASIVACRSFAFAALPADFEGDYLEVLIQLVREKMQTKLAQMGEPGNAPGTMPGNDA